MNKLILALTLSLISAMAFADKKISELTLTSASATNISDSFPYVNSVAGATQRVLLSDLIHIPTVASKLLSMVPSQASQNGKCLETNGINTLWGTCVTNVALADASTTPLFNVSGSPITTTGVLSLTLRTQVKNCVVAGPVSGANAQPGCRLLQGADIPTPSLVALGGVEAINAVANSFITSIDTSGIPHVAQPAFTDISGIAAITQGGTGQASANAGFNALSPMTTLGDIVYENATPAGARLAGNTTAVKQFLTQTGTGSISAAPAWGVILGSDITSAVPITAGGTGQITKAAAFDALSPMTTGGDLIYGGASGTATRLANGTSGYVLTSNGGTSPPTWQAAGAGSAITVAYRLTANALGTALQPVNFDYMRWDTGPGCPCVTASAPGTGSWVFTNNSGGNKYFHVSGSMILTSNNTEYVAVFVNGNVTPAIPACGIVSAFNGQGMISCDVFLNAGDTMDIRFLLGNTAQGNALIGGAAPEIAIHSID